MILTQGEKMVWAATFAKGAFRAMENNQIDRDRPRLRGESSWRELTTAEWVEQATEVACRIVRGMRTGTHAIRGNLLMERLSPEAGQMLHAMLEEDVHHDESKVIEPIQGDKEC